VQVKRPASICRGCGFTFPLFSFAGDVPGLFSGGFAFVPFLLFLLSYVHPLHNMSKIADRNNKFSELRAEYSERMRSNGKYEGYCATPELFAPLLAQYKAGRERIDVLRKFRRTMEEEREMQNHIRICGSWEKQLKDGARLAFENAFVTVAQARLPKEHFLVISDEARVLWRMFGFDAGAFPSDRQITKAEKSRSRSK
jgi:hypothetical protein